jgi:hypothetical protein
MPYRLQMQGTTDIVLMVVELPHQILEYLLLPAELTKSKISTSFQS